MADGNQKRKAADAERLDPGHTIDYDNSNALIQAIRLSDELVAGSRMIDEQSKLSAGRFHSRTPRFQAGNSARKPSCSK